MSNALVNQTNPLEIEKESFNAANFVEEFRSMTSTTIDSAVNSLEVTSISEIERKAYENFIRNLGATLGIPSEAIEIEIQNFRSSLNNIKGEA